MDRRSALRLGATAALTPLAGCSLPTVRERGVALSTMTIRNRTDSAVEVSVLLTEEEEVALWRTLTVGTAPDQFATIDDLPDERGAYTLYAQLPAVDDDAPVQADLVDESGDSSCIGLGLEVLRSESVEQRRVVDYTTTRECGDGP